MGFIPTKQRTPVQPITYAPPPGASRTVLVAGASGRLGRHVVRELKQRGYRVRAMSRDPLRLAALSGEMDSASRGDVTDPESLVGSCAGADVIISCIGAPLHPTDAEQHPRFAEIDVRGTANLLRIAREAEIARFVCVAPFDPERLHATDYGAAREEMVAMVEDSGLPYTVVRPTMMFGLCTAVLPLVARGRRWLIGDPDARINAIDERDVAELCVGAVMSDVTTIEAGGPDTLTLRQMVRQLMDALACSATVTPVPSWLCRGLAGVIRPFRPHAASLMELADAALNVDVVAPVLGRRRWSEYLPSAGGTSDGQVTANAARGGAMGKVRNPDSSLR